MKALPNPTCPLCGGQNRCAPAVTGKLGAQCWCTHLEFDQAALALVPAELRNRHCLCETCAKNGIAGAPIDPQND